VNTHSIDDSMYESRIQLESALQKGNFINKYKTAWYFSAFFYCKEHLLNTVAKPYFCHFEEKIRGRKIRYSSRLES